jgi:GT2 family glycosyltransferase/glycosyltransferase involved in cell wall biosynthesis
MGRFLGILRVLPLLALSPILVGLPALALALSDLFWKLAGRRAAPVNRQAGNQSASVVIPNWNGRDLLEKYLPSVIAAMQFHPGNEVIVVDNGSTDGSAEFVRSRFPSVNLVPLPRNLGFGGGSNAGFRAAKNDIVILLNSDMRVEPGFAGPLLAAFDAPDVFAVSCQILFTDPKKTREETGLTQGWWEAGGLRVRHRLDGGIGEPFPCFYGGGGSCAFDREKFLEIGGFDELLRPFYLEDTDLGYLAWKRGWKVLYQPASIVYHEHRGTIGRNFSREFIDAVIKKNFLLFAWKNIHDWLPAGSAPSAVPGSRAPGLLSHFLYSWSSALISALFGDSPERTNAYALWKAFLQTPAAVRSRWRARSLAVIDDQEAFRRPLGGYYHDRFRRPAAEPEKLNVLFVSPYPICPPNHGGAVFMLQTCRHLARHTGLHLVVLLDSPAEEPAHGELVSQCISAHFLVRLEGQPRHFGSILPHAIHEFANADLEWLIHRQIYLHRIDAVQLDYLPMGQYWCDFRQTGMFLFEHDIYFQSVGRQLTTMTGALRRLTAFYEYLRALRYETGLLPCFDRVQVCSRENGDFVRGFLPRQAQLDDGLRAGIDVSKYEHYTGPRTPDTLLFLGSFRHAPNAEAIQWFLRRVFPLVIERRPQTKLILVGSDPPPRYSLPAQGGSIELRGFVEDITAPLRECAVFLCPILSGSGVRVKLLEAFASGIPTVSTRLGAEGLARRDGEICALADEPAAFAQRILDLLEQPEEAAAMAARARREVETNWDMAVRTAALVESYRETIKRKRRNATA